jgi:hypothetical protein
VAGRRRQAQPAANSFWKARKSKKVRAPSPSKSARRVARGEEVLEGEEVEEGELAVAIEVGAAEEAAEVEDVRGAGPHGRADGLARGADDDAGAVGSDRVAVATPSRLGDKLGLAPRAAGEALESVSGAPLDAGDKLPRGASDDDVAVEGDEAPRASSCTGSSCSSVAACRHC